MMAVTKKKQENKSSNEKIKPGVGKKKQTEGINLGGRSRLLSDKMCWVSGR